MTIDYDDLLDAFLAGEEDDGAAIDFDAEPPPITNLDDLDRLLFRVRLVDADADRIAAAAATRIDEIARWRDDLLAGLDRKRKFFARAAEGFAVAHFAQQPAKVKTIKVPNGEITRRAQRKRVLDVTDDIAAAIHAFDPALAPTGKPKIAKTVIADRCEPGKAIGAPDEEGFVAHQAVRVDIDDTGEVTRTPVPGVVFMVPTRDKISAKPKAVTKPADDTEEADDDG